MSLVDEVKRPLPVILGIIAVVGWVFALFLIGERATLRTDLADQNEAVGTVRELQSEATTLTSQTEALDTQRDEINAEITTQQSNLSTLQDEVATTQISLDKIRSEQSAIEDQLAPMREEITGFETARTKAQNNATEATQELADMGDRLTEARATQAELQQQLSVLTDDTSRLAQEASDAEARVQEARDAEAASQAAVAAATEELGRITTERDAVSKELDDMIQRRDQLAADNTAAEEQRQSVQAIVTQLSEDLASRSQQLAETEQRISELQKQGVQAQGQQTQDQQDQATRDQDTQGQEQKVPDPAPQTQSEDQVVAALEPGSYSGGAISMILANDGRFTLTNADRGKEVTGRYETTDGEITLSDAVGDVGTTIFPVTCGVQRAETGFAIAQVGDEICPLAGLELRAQ